MNRVGTRTRTSHVSTSHVSRRRRTSHVARARHVHCLINPITCSRIVRARGPSSSATITRCHWPRTSSPPVTCSVRLWPSSIARRCESAFIRSQSECSRVVVHPVVFPGDRAIEKALDVRVQGRLRLVDENRARRVERPDADRSFLEARGANESHHPIGEVGQLDPFGGLNRDRLRAHHQPAGRSRGSRQRADTLRDRRTLAHALLSVSYLGLENTPSYWKHGRSGNACYTRRTTDAG